jgi:hypothetical protein
MTWYEFLLFFHISMAVIWVGGATMIQFFFRADLMLLFLIIFDIATKPQWGDLSLWVALAGFAILAGILVRNGLNTRLAAAAAANPSYSSSSISS